MKKRNRTMMMAYQQVPNQKMENQRRRRRLMNLHAQRLRVRKADIKLSSRSESRLPRKEPRIRRSLRNLRVI
jgi:hypothetical protein